MATQTLTTADSSPWSCPVGATDLIIDCYAAGASGGGGGSTNKYGGDGGGGGAFSRLTIASPSGDYNFSVGVGGTGSSQSDGQHGGDTWFGSTTTCFAQGGRRGLDYDTAGTESQGGSSGSGYGDLCLSGGNGDVGTTTYSGGGGGGAGPGGVGGNASGLTGGIGNPDGGNGGDGTGDNTANGSPGSPYGGGGAGATKNGVPGSGANGKIVLTWTPGITPIEKSTGDDSSADLTDAILPFETLSPAVAGDDASTDLTDAAFVSEPLLPAATGDDSSTDLTDSIDKDLSGTTPLEKTIGDDNSTNLSDAVLRRFTVKMTDEVLTFLGTALTLTDDAVTDLTDALLASLSLNPAVADTASTDLVDYILSLLTASILAEDDASTDLTDALTAGLSLDAAVTDDASTDLTDAIDQDLVELGTTPITKATGDDISTDLDDAVSLNLGLYASVSSDNSTNWSDYVTFYRTTSLTDEVEWWLGISLSVADDTSSTLLDEVDKYLELISTTPIDKETGDDTSSTLLDAAAVFESFIPSIGDDASSTLTDTVIPKFTLSTSTGDTADNWLDETFIDKTDTSITKSVSDDASAALTDAVIPSFTYSTSTADDSNNWSDYINAYLSEPTSDLQAAVGDSLRYNIESLTTALSDDASTDLTDDISVDLWEYGFVPLTASMGDLNWKSGTRLTWDSPPESVTGYMVYWGTSPGTYSDSTDVGNVTAYTVTGHAYATTYYFAVKAYYGSQYSSYSNEVESTGEYPRDGVQAVGGALTALCADDASSDYSDLVAHSTDYTLNLEESLTLDDGLSVDLDVIILPLTASMGDIYYNPDRDSVSITRTPSFLRILVEDDANNYNDAILREGLKLIRQRHITSDPNLTIP